MLFSEFGERTKEGAICKPITIYRSREQDNEHRWMVAAKFKRRFGRNRRWQQDTIFPKHHLDQSVRLVGSFSSIWPTRYETLFPDAEDFGEQGRILIYKHEISAVTQVFCDAELTERNQNGARRNSHV